MLRKKSDLLLFQQCTANWVIHKLFDTRRTHNRFLVADEVGLGKTKIASSVIGHLQQQLQNKNGLVLYISSNLDICRANKSKLIKNLDPVRVSEVDRITLLFSNDEIDKKNDKKLPKFRLITLTPGTSFEMTNSSGSMKERAYMLFFIKKYLGLRGDRHNKVFSDTAHEKNFLRMFDEYKGKWALPPERICQAIVSLWKAEGLIDLLSYGEIKKADLRLLRKKMAEAMISKMNPDLIILDEVQKFPQIIRTNDDGQLAHEVAGHLFDRNTKTLLLSATPYKTYVSQNDHSSASAHADEFENVFRFLTGSAKEAKTLLDQLKNVGDELKVLKEHDVEAFIQNKKKIEKRVLEYMSRTERIAFQQVDQVYEEKYLSDQKYEISKDLIQEWFLSKNGVQSQGAYLHLWRSGHSPKSYLKEYESVYLNKMARSSKLYSRINPPKDHPKLNYIKDEILAQGNARDFLWIPPTQTYYAPEGIFKDQLVKTKNGFENSIKKGLVFSSWAFVPRFVANELSHIQHKPHNTSNPLKIAPTSWGRFFHPSLFLAEIIRHDEFVNHGTDYNSLRKKVANLIRKKINGESKLKGEYVPAWKFLANQDFNKLTTWHDHVLSNLNRRSPLFRLHEIREETNNADIKKLVSAIDDPVYSHKVISKRAALELADIALTSPAVCLLRSIIARKWIDTSNVDEFQLGQLSDFCARNLVSFFNRKSTSAVILKAQRGRGTYPEKLQGYLRDGNIQAVLDEYLAHLDIENSNEKKPVPDLLDKLKFVFGPKTSKLRIQIANGKMPTRGSDIVVPFGDGAIEAMSRSAVREAFNSPFWPFVLATTSVGQEGLDFHLYCRDILHWNLPANPVDFEQREGRINRFKSLWVRKAIHQNIGRLKLNDGEFLWDQYFKMANEECGFHDRYSLGMAPNWCFTGNHKKPGSYIRHILDLPHSVERNHYDALTRELDLYRMTLGQPYQAEFMKSLKGNSLLNGANARLLSFNFFPNNPEMIVDNLIELYCSGDRELHHLENDIQLFLFSHQKSQAIGKIRRLLLKDLSQLRKINASDGHKSAKFRKIMREVMHILNPFDEIHDRTPGVGLKDDVKRRKRAA